MRNRYGNPRHKQAHKMRIGVIEDISPLIVFAVCTLLSMAIYIGSSSLFSLTVGKPGLTTASAAKDTNLAPFRLAKLQMGMTSAEASSLYPGMIFSGNPNGKQTGSYKFGNASYTVTFLGPMGARKAYLIKYSEKFWDYSEVELRQSLKRKFGQPDVNHCSLENPAKGWECRLRWFRADGVHLDAVTKTLGSFNGTRITHLSFAAIDKSLENRIIEPAPVTPFKRRASMRKSRSFMMRMRAISEGANRH